MWPHGLQTSRHLCPWDFWGKNTGVGCHFLLQGIFLTQGLTQASLIAGRFFTLTWKHQGSPPFYRFHQLEIHLIEHLLFERWNLNGVGRKVGEGWILNPCFTWVNMNYLKRESDRSLRRHSGNPHCGLGKEKERTFSVPRESGQRNYLHYSHPLEKYLFGRLELTAPIRLCLSIWVFPV